MECRTSTWYDCIHACKTITFFNLNVLHLTLHLKFHYIMLSCCGLYNMLSHISCMYVKPPHMDRLMSGS
uniref:Uncharacterized protein n=1 Tax=Anguilla anguilla TaxID=7936 RepID=A0A0E9X236_ANGAN